MQRFKGIKKIDKTHLEEISPDEFRQISFQIFKTFVRFCDEHHLRYFLAGGTLIGAVRHQGFVWWDDDMDITMPRPDFEKFRELTKSGHLAQYKIMSIYHTPKEHSLPFLRIEDDNFFADSTELAQVIYAWIDIMPWDGLPQNSEQHWKKVQQLKSFNYFARFPRKRLIRGKYKEFKFLLNNLLYIASIPFKIVGAHQYALKIDELGKKYDFETAAHVGTFVAGYGPKEEMPKWWFIDEKIGERYLFFEGIKARVPAHYDLVLQHMYGDFMTLPKKKKTHIIQAYRVIKNREETNV